MLLAWAKGGPNRIAWSVDNYADDKQGLKPGMLS
jgi:hypothetical protein